MKDNKTMILIVVIVLLLFGLSYSKSRQPKPMDWTPTFINTKTDPYGTYIVYELLGDIFDKDKIRVTRRPIYNNVKDGVEDYFAPENDFVDHTYTKSDDETYDRSDEVVYATDEYDEENDYTHAEYIDDDTIYSTANLDPSVLFHSLDSVLNPTTYIFINSRFDIDELNLKYLLNYVGLGNDVFISSETFSSLLMDTLNIKNSNAGYFNASDTIFTLTDYSHRRYQLKPIFTQTKFNLDSCTLPIRTLAYNNKKEPVYIDVTYGKGHIFLHAIPMAFTNINVLKDSKYDFPFRCLSYLPRDHKIIWDEYQKQGMVGNGDSPFKIMIESKPLHLALYLILLGLFLLMVFKAKRTQRVIPVINPPVNSSLEFLGTISNLYYRKKDFKTIAEKRQAYFLDYVRKNYYLSTEKFDTDFFNILSKKSGVEIDKIKELFDLYNDIILLPYINNDVFLKYNSLLEEFYRIVKNK